MIWKIADHRFLGLSATLSIQKTAIRASLAGNTQKAATPPNLPQKPN
jgi:hypothetical protein